ncbi:exocyst complex component Sec3-domain-containing protein [Halteromyces radiatus]|uniref:exocyst complex component Sec3-domain-containing protein n=1 Tax=Halteromyces radiatus TaxID=101107 RepID=UPI00222011A5|nr:exocyst complex component Sec3-domain-containing protein [Halteromyces radiatus]KAI8097568.1 exocyst complex component Sec3-domain-containing protein [Halteromyces radiatus]
MSDDIRAAITASLFSPDVGGVAEKLLIHLKVFEDLKQGDASKGAGIMGKPRYLCLTQKRNRCRLYKTKRNQNGTFSIGKSWSLEDIRQAEVIDAILAHRSAPPLGSPVSSQSSNNQQIPSPTYNNLTSYETETQPRSPNTLQSTPISSNNYPNPISPSASTGRLTPTQETFRHSPISSPHPLSDQKDERKEREKAREQRREREKLEKESREEQAKQERALELQDKMTEQASLMNVEEILTDFNWKTSGNAAVLEKRLLGELHALEAANVHAIIQSDERVQSVVDRIDKALEDLDNMESWLSLYAAELNSMGDDIHEIETQNRGLQILTVNQNNLIKELDHILNEISIPRESLDNLKYDPMDTTDDIVEIQNSAELLQRALKIKLPDNLHELTAVQEMIEKYNIYSNEFSSRIFDYLKSKFEHQAGAFMSNKPPTQRKVPIAYPHEQVEDALIRYQGFSLWEKEMEPRMYNELQRHYASTMAPTYERDIRDMVEVTRPYYSTLRNRSLEDVDYLFRNDESRSARALAYGAKLGNVATGGSVGSGGNIGGDSSRHRNVIRGSLDGQSSVGNMDEDEKAASDAFSHLMNQCALQVCREQNFVCDLFEQSPFAPKSFLDRGPVYASVPDKSRLYSHREKIRDVKISKKVQTWMETIFESLEPSVVPLVEYGLKSDPIQAVSMMTSVEFQLEKWKESDQEFIYTFFDSLMLRVRRYFKQFVLDQIKIIDDTKVSSKKRRGILPSFRTFPLFVARIELASTGAEADSQTRQTINDAYDKIIKSMMSSLDTNAKESDETGDDKEQLNANIMYIENMHHFYQALRSNRLPVLEKWVKEAKAKYETSLDAYIKVVIRRPLGKLLEFFDGVEVLLRTSTPEEVAFHVNYNKSQLRKVIALYPPKDVRKSLEQLYKRVDKHYSEEEGLLQVMWRGIQEELIGQHERMEGLISKCYPDAGVHLEFSIPDLLAMMGDQQTR